MQHKGLQWQPGDKNGLVLCMSLLCCGVEEYIVIDLGLWAKRKLTRCFMMGKA